MQPHDHTFAHMTEMLKGITNHVAARSRGWQARQNDHAGKRRSQLRAALPNVAPESLRVSLRMLVEQDILVQPAPDRWQFASLLFQQWLAING